MGSPFGDVIVEGEVADEGERWMILTGCVFSKGR